MYFVITQNTRSERSRGVHDLKPAVSAGSSLSRTFMKREALGAFLEVLGPLLYLVYQGYTPDEKHM